MIQPPNRLEGTRGKRIAYSCVVDGAAKFEWQAALLVQSLINNAGIAPEDIKVHCLPTVSAAATRHFRQLGLAVFAAAPFPKNHGYCNKISQMFSPAFVGYDKAVLCDCDLFFLSPIDPCAVAAPIAGKIVDRPNPPLNLLIAIFEKFGLSPPAPVLVDFPRGPTDETFETNWNGGLYFIEPAVMADLGGYWRDNALRLIDNIGWLGNFANHADQVALALAILQLGLKFELLDSTCNFPVHLKMDSMNERLSATVRVLHYHDLIDSDGRISKTGYGAVDREISRANALIDSRFEHNASQNELLCELLTNWRHNCLMRDRADELVCGAG